MALTTSIKRACAISGYMHRHELQWLAEQASAAQIAVEIGSWKGRSTRAIGDHIGKYLISIDSFSGSKGKGDYRQIQKEGTDTIWEMFLENVGDLICSGKVIPIRAKSDDVLPLLAGLRGCVDFVFIDADHSYEAVSRDILLSRVLLREGGQLCGHDFHSRRHRGVRKAVKELLPEWENAVRSMFTWRMRSSNGGT